MKIVVLTANSTYVNYIVQGVDEAFGVAKMVHVTLAPKRLGFWQQLRRLFSAKLLFSLEQRFFYRPLCVSQDRQVMDSLSVPQLSSRLDETLEIPASELNSVESMAKIRALEPDILLVCCAPLLKPEIYTIPKIAALNIHFGVAPNYRGENTIFWPMYFRDYRNIGVTVHRISAGIDSGDIVAQGAVQIEPTDTMVSLHAKSIRMATELVVDALSSADPDVLNGKPQSEKGRVFLFRSRRLWHDSILFLRMFLRLDRLPNLPEIRWVNTKKPAYEDITVS